jgi:3-deoxy-D-manno-octulosonic acid kinase
MVPLHPQHVAVRVVARPAARSTLKAWIGRSGTLIDAAAERDDAEPLQGRGRVYVVPAPLGLGGRWVIRHYFRGGAVASLLDDRYLRVGTPRPVHEFRVGRTLEEIGVPTPPHIGAAVYPDGPFYRGDLVTEWVPGSRDLAGVLFPDNVGPAIDVPAFDPMAAMRAAGVLVRLLHDRGVHHPDLNLKNILVTKRGDELRALVLDLDRARVRARVGKRARDRMLARFWRSARKWEGVVGRLLDARLQAAFERGYAG